MPYHRICSSTAKGNAGGENRELSQRWACLSVAGGIMTSEEEPLPKTSAEKPLPRTSAEKAAFVQWRPCANPGNPVFSCMLDPKSLTTSNFLTKPKSLLFKTTSSEYGAIPPTSQMVPCNHFPRDNAFTNHLFHCGLTQHNYINTGTDKDNIYDFSTL